MKSVVLVFMLMAIWHVAWAETSDRLGVFVGGSHLVTSGEANTYRVKPNGVTGGFLIPVHLTSTPLFVKLKVLYHGADFASGVPDAYTSYIHASNSILVGVKTWRHGEYSAQVLLGPGILNESAYSQWGAGVSAAEVFGEISVIAAKRVANQNIGVLATFERGITSEHLHLVADRRLQLALVAIF
jgi:hypothetical protein